jgi:hypothetical protein
MTDTHIHITVHNLDVENPEFITRLQAFLLEQPWAEDPGTRVDFAIYTDPKKPRTEGNHDQP